MYCQITVWIALLPFTFCKWPNLGGGGGGGVLIEFKDNFFIYFLKFDEKKTK